MALARRRAYPGAMRQLTARAAPIALALAASCLWPATAHAHGTGVGLVLFGALGAGPALLIGVVHAALALRWLSRAERPAALLRILGATFAALVGTFLLQGAAEATLQSLWLPVALAIDLAAYALAALPLTLALVRADQRPRARRVFLVSVLAGPVGAGLLMAWFTFGPRG